MRIGLCILTWNEYEGISALWDQIDQSLFDEVFVVDPGSTDGTLEFFEEHNVKVYIQKNKGRGNAFREAFKRTDFDAIVFFSGDGNEDPSDLPKMVKYLGKGHDMVIGCRVLRKGSMSDNSDDPFRIRLLGNVAFGLITRLLWQTGVYEAVNGYRAITRDAFEKMNLDAEMHEIELQSTIRAGKLNLDIKEFPTKELLRIGNPRKQSAATITLGKTLLKTLLKEIWIGMRFLK